MPKYDFFAPTFSATLLVADQSVSGNFPLTFAQGPIENSLARKAGLQIPDGAVFNCIPYLSSISIKMQLGYPGGLVISATLTPPIHEAIAILESPLIEFGTSSIEVQFGYTLPGNDLGRMSPRLVGLIATSPEVTIGMETSIVLHAQGIGGASGYVSNTNPAPVPQSRMSVIQQLIEGPDGLNPRKVTVTLSDDINLDTNEGQKLLVEQIVPIQAGVPDWFMIATLVRECGCWMYEINDELRIMPVGPSMKKNAKYKLQLFDLGDNGQIGPAVGVFPILSVSSPTKGMYTAGIRGMVQRGINDLTREPTELLVTDNKKFNEEINSAQWKAIGAENAVQALVTRGELSQPQADAKIAEIRKEAQAKQAELNAQAQQSRERIIKEAKQPRIGATQANGTVAAAPTASSTAPGVNKNTSQGMAFFPGNPSNPTFSNLAASEYENIANAMGTALEIETLGMPDILPADSLQVDGLGKRYNGNYTVMSIEHVLSGSGFTTKLSLRSNALPILAKAVEASMAANTSPAQPQNSGTEVKSKSAT